MDTHENNGVIQDIKCNCFTKKHWHLLTCGCLLLVTPQRVVLVCEAIHMCILPSVDAQVLLAAACHLLVLANSIILDFANSYIEICIPVLVSAHVIYVF